MRLQLPLTLTAVLLLAADKKPNTAPKELKKLQGTWKASRALPKGKKVPKVSRAFHQLKLIITGNKYVLKTADTTILEATFTLDPTKKPRRIDLHFTGGPVKGETRLGIYEVSRNTLTIELGRSSKDRPRKFSAKRQSFKRVKG
jgi:uncharacterized protein (TIGR03067 family)